MDIAEVSRRLSDQAEAVASYLLPNGKLISREWCAGSVDGEEGKSLKVCVSGTKQGVWSDFAAGNAGDLIDLWCAARSLTKGEAFVAAKAWLGVDDTDYRPKAAQARRYKKPQRNKTTKPLSQQSAVVAYLMNERKLSAETIKAYKIAETESIPCKGKNGEFEWQGPWITFPFIDPSGELISLKYLHIDRDDKGKKITTVSADCRPVLFGWQAIDTESRDIYITEGEIDAPTMFDYGYPAVSVPFGGGVGQKQQWIDHEWDRLETFERIYLCLDDDAEGQAAMTEIAGRLGLHRCYIVTLPRKDANKCIQEGVTKAEIDTAIANAVMLSPESMRSAAEFTGPVMDLAFPSGGKVPGIDLPWVERDKQPIRLARGQLSLWTGINGHGKSLLLGYVIAHGIVQGDPGFIASLEMPSPQTLFRLVKQVTCMKQPSRAYIKSCLEWLGENLWLFDVVGSVKIDELLKVCEYAYRRHGSRQFVIDSLMRLGVHSDDYNGQKDVIEKILKFCEATGAHVHLVVHPRKGQDEDSPPGKLDIKGGGDISDLAYNSFTVFRNKSKEKRLAKLRRGIPVKGQDEETVNSEADTLIFCDKCRDDGMLEGRIALKYDGPSGAYYQHKKQVLYTPNTGTLPDGF